MRSLLRISVHYVYEVCPDQFWFIFQSLAKIWVLENVPILRSIFSSYLIVDLFQSFGNLNYGCLRQKRFCHIFQKQFATMKTKMLTIMVMICVMFTFHVEMSVEAALTKRLLIVLQKNFQKCCRKIKCRNQVDTCLGPEDFPGLAIVGCTCKRRAKIFQM